jgi:diguanylate cyclase (GGDEF)-like protein/PAS domain S-box-containing protein
VIVAGASGLVGTQDAVLEPGLHEFRTMFERGSLGQLVVDLPSLRIRLANKAFRTMTDFASDELVGTDYALMFPANQNPPNDIVARLTDGAASVYSAERLMRRRDGTTLPVRATVSVVRDDGGTPVRLFVLAEDLTQTRVAQEVQSRSQALIEAAIATLPVTFTTLDTELRFTFLAGGMEGVAGRPVDLLGRHVSEITNDPAIFVALQKALAGSESTTRTVVNDKTFLAVSAPRRDDTGAIIGVTSVTTNITAEVRAQAERARADELRLFAARYDRLTAIPGTAALIDQLDDLAVCGKGGGALLLLNLDDFSLINDSLGRTVGDAVLIEVSKRLWDAFPGLMVARQGADEFAVVAPSVGDRAQSEAAAERACAAISPVVEIGHHALRVTASVGIAFEKSRASTSTLIRNADLALMSAKQAGAGQYRVYGAGMGRQIEHRFEIQDGLREALLIGQLRIAYQPIVRLVDRNVVGSEALLRWTHPVLGNVAPGDFIPIAENSGLIVPIGKWVMKSACEAMLALKHDYGMYVAVNVSVRQLLEGGFSEWVEEVIAATGLPPPALTIEVTEGAFMNELSLVRAAFERLRARGIKVAIDDFGTGYSSLARLQHLPVDVIKLDRAFVTDIDVRSEARAMATAILQLSAAIGADVVAEGIETEAEAATLLELGFTAGQGFLFAPAMPIADFTAGVCAGAPGAWRAACVATTAGAAHG